MPINPYSFPCAIEPVRIFFKIGKSSFRRHYIPPGLVVMVALGSIARKAVIAVFAACAVESGTSRVTSGNCAPVTGSQWLFFVDVQ